MCGEMSPNFLVSQCLGKRQCYHPSLNEDNKVAITMYVCMYVCMHIINT